VERLLKFLLWQKGGCRITVAGDAGLSDYLRGVYAPAGERAFDYEFMGERIYGKPLTVASAAFDAAPPERETAAPLGRHLEGCRIGFDLGASDRKCAAVIDGKVVFSEEVGWNPSVQSDPQYHFDGIHDSLRAPPPTCRAWTPSAAAPRASTWPTKCAWGRSIAGCRAPSSTAACGACSSSCSDAWGGVPFRRGQRRRSDRAGRLHGARRQRRAGHRHGQQPGRGIRHAARQHHPWLNELAFVPVDYRADAPADEWSGDRGVGVQYFSQQAVGRLLAPAGIDLPAGMPLPVKLEQVQSLMAAGDARARRIYQTIGVYFGYAIATYADFYDFRNLLVLGRVLSGEGGDLILAVAREVLRAEFPEIAERVRYHIPGEQEKRHGQAIAAASLPAISYTEER
jgi:hypothetical protein